MFTALLCQACISVLQVKPVTRGHRITLTYELTASGMASAGMPATLNSGTAKSTLLFADLQAALHDPTFMPSGAEVAWHDEDALTGLGQASRMAGLAR